MYDPTIIEQIHESPKLAVLAITGGGSEAVGELLRHGNGSKTLLEAVIPYDQVAFQSFIRGTPDKYCSPGAARDLAMAAYQRALKLASLEKATNLVGIGGTCSLVKQNERQGRRHAAYIAAQTHDRTVTYTFDMTPGEDFPVTREDEETYVAHQILNILAEACGVMPDLPFEKTVIQGAESHFRLLTGQAHYSCRDKTNHIIFPGSFNPIHDRHLEMAEAVCDLYGSVVDFEVCVHNVDKPAMNFQSLQERERDLLAVLSDKYYFGNLHFTHTATFVQKAELFPGCRFLVGWGTFRRIGDVKYYGGSENRDRAIARLKELTQGFIVCHRVIDGVATNDEHLEEIHPILREMAIIVPVEVLPPSPLSSSEIRKSQNKDS